MYNILIVEDEVEMANIVSEMVKTRGDCNPIVAHNGKAALQTMRKYERGLGFLNSAIDCILLDWQMPEMNGHQFLKALRKLESRRMFRRFVPVVIVSAYNDMEKWSYATDSQLGMAAGHLVKPIVQAELMDTLDMILLGKDNECLVDLTREKRYRLEREIHHAKVMQQFK